ncbi:MAG: DNA-binding protein, partial [Lachnospiraceae bacterium]|nr:DNA-binding protein [Lachnospiraceae bacterium]
LLTESKRRIFENYILNDLSLSEIADLEGMTRQGVHDTVKRCIAQFKTYEEKLRLIENKKKVEEELDKIIGLLEDASLNNGKKDEVVHIIDKIRQDI